MGKQARRQGSVQHACRREVQRYKEKRLLIEGSIAAAELGIEEAKLALQEAQVVRRHQEEYEVKRTEVMRQMGRPATAAEAASVREEVAAIQAESEHLDRLLALRRKQFSGLLHCLEVLQKAIDEEDAAADDALTKQQSRNAS